MTAVEHWRGELLYDITNFAVTMAILWRQTVPCGLWQQYHQAAVCSVSGAEDSEPPRRNCLWHVRRRNPKQLAKKLQDAWVWDDQNCISFCEGVIPMNTKMWMVGQYETWMSVWRSTPTQTNLFQMIKFTTRPQPKCMKSHVAQKQTNREWSTPALFWSCISLIMLLQLQYKYCIWEQKTLLSRRALWEIKHSLHAHKGCSYSTVGRSHKLCDL